MTDSQGFSPQQTWTLQTHHAYELEWRDKLIASLEATNEDLRALLKKEAGAWSALQVLAEVLAPALARYEAQSEASA